MEDISRGFQHTLEVLRDRIRYTVKEPLTCQIKSVTMIGTNNIDRNFYHIVIDTNERYIYKPGQYCGIIPPGIWSKTNRRYPPRSYSIAPVLEGDDFKRCFAICIKRVIPDDISKGICSRFLSSSLPGTPINITGPFGTFCLSDDDSRGDLIFIATGTGISPIRGFLRLLLQRHHNGHKIGNIILIFGIQNEDTFIYHDELYNYKSIFNDKLEIIPAFSKLDSSSQRVYVQDQILNNRNILVPMILNGAKVFICGRKSMELPVMESLHTILEGISNKDEIIKSIKAEVYE